MILISENDEVASNNNDIQNKSAILPVTFKETKYNYLDGNG